MCHGRHKHYSVVFESLSHIGLSIKDEVSFFYLEIFRISIYTYYHLKVTMSIYNCKKNNRK